MTPRIIRLCGVIALISGAWHVLAADAGQPVTKRRPAAVEAEAGSSSVWAVRPKRVQPGEPVTGTAASVSRLSRKEKSAAVTGVGIVAEMAAVAPANDDCQNAEPITGTGTFAFDNSTATKDGLDHGGLPADTTRTCVDENDAIGAIDHDVWFSWTATCSGPVTVTTCQQTDVDTKIAVYDGCAACPPTGADLFPFGCNDDDVFCDPVVQLQSTVTFQAQNGQSYFVRIGTFPGFPRCFGGGNSGQECADDTDCPDGTCEVIQTAPGGVGTFTITCLDPPCQQEPSLDTCQPLTPFNGHLSDRTNFIAADGFTATSTGSITGLCWWGSYCLGDPCLDVPPLAYGRNDTFEVTYYADDAGLPGAVIGGPFVQANGTLIVSDPVDTGAGEGFRVFEHTATHNAFSVTAGECYWVEITNDVPRTPTENLANLWFWQWGTGGDLSSVLDGEENPATPPDGYDAGDVVSADLAFCLDRPAESCQPSVCIGATGPCCDLNPLADPGCGDPECCAKVCACDPLCCDPGIGWDEYCVGGPGFERPCSAAALCYDLCAGCPDGAVTWLDPDGNPLPPGGIVYAVHPQPLNRAAAPQWLETFQVEAPPGASKDVVGGCWTLCETDNTTAENSILDIVEECDGFYTITLARPITPGALTQITYTSDTVVSYAGSYAFLPGDTTGNRLVETDDIDHLIGCINGSVCERWHADINHSGAVNALDVAWEIGLLNGAGDSDVWFKRNVPTVCIP